MGLLQIKEKTKKCDCNMSFPDRLRQAVDTTLPDPVSIVNLITSVQVFIHCQHFLGPHQIVMSKPNLSEGLQLWAELKAAKGPALYIGGGVTAAYTPEAVAQQ